MTTATSRAAGNDLAGCHWRLTMPGIGSHGSALIARAAASSPASPPRSTASLGRRLFMSVFLSSGGWFLPGRFSVF
jgi:hypothetical protein